MSERRRERSAGRGGEGRGGRARAEGAGAGAGDEVQASALSPGEVRAALEAGGLGGLSVTTLIALGVLTPKGGASPSAHRKLKQISHFLQLIAPALTEIFERHEDPVIVDMGAGKAAISLALYDVWVRPQGRGRVVAVESREDITAKVREVVAEEYPRFEVVTAEILSAALPERWHLTLALHACDLATDHALIRALDAKSDHVALVPCCQAEVARLLQPVKGSATPLAALWSDPWHRREFGSHLTNVSRALALRAMGYAVTVTELTGWEHSLKNELIVGRRVARFHRGAREELRALLAQAQVRPWLLGALEGREWGEEAAPPEQAAQAAPPEGAPTGGLASGAEGV